MRNKVLVVVAVACGLIAAAVPVAAHHSFAAQYDRNKQATLTGPVSKVDWINPHARFILDVKDATGKVAKWEVELSAPAILMRRGWTRNSLTVGEVITVSGSLAKDGSNMINASSVTLASGKRVFSGSAEEEDGAK
jgi:hypothetical protein